MSHSTCVRRREGKEGRGGRKRRRRRRRREKKRDLANDGGGGGDVGGGGDGGGDSDFSAASDTPSSLSTLPCARKRAKRVLEGRKRRKKSFSLSSSPRDFFWDNNAVGREEMVGAAVKSQKLSLRRKKKPKLIESSHVGRIIVAFYASLRLHLNLAALLGSKKEEEGPRERERGGGNREG